ncbi:MAG: phosphotransferase [Pseudomonadota bacterium]
MEASEHTAGSDGRALAPVDASDKDLCAAASRLIRETEALHAPLRRPDPPVTLLSRRGRHVVVLAGQRGPEALVFKFILRDGQASKSRGAFAQTQAAHRALTGHPRFAVVAPVCLMAEDCGFAMRFVAGEQLATRAKSWRSGPRRRQALASDALAWLETFHQAMGRASRGLDPDWFAARLDTITTKSAEKPETTRHSETFHRARERWYALGTGLAGTALPFAPAHGDFGLHNLLQTRTRLTAIDFSAERAHPAEPVTRDLARFAATLPAMPGWRQETEKSALLQAGYPGLDWSSPATAWALIYHHLNAWSSHRHRARSQAGRFETDAAQAPRAEAMLDALERRL